MIRRALRNFYWPLFLTAVIISVLGVIFIFSASYSLETNYALKQSVWLFISMTALFLVVLVGYRPFLNVSYVLYGLSILLLLFLLFLGSVKQGSQRWIAIGPFGFQPSEFCKLATILCLANYLGDRKNIHQMSCFVITFILVFVPILLILKQPDLGTALIFLPILFCMLYMWGAKIKYLFMTLVLGLLGVPFLWNLLKEYQKRRLLVFVNPNIDPLGAGYTAIQSKVTIGSGGLFGKGWLAGSQIRLNFLPEHHTDFIFCTVAEQLGFFGSILVIMAYVILFWLAFRVIEKTTDRKALLLASGIVSMLFFHIIINIGMTIGLMPITGLPLPFLSYGGSSLVTTFIAIGFLISIHKERSIF